MFAWRIALHYPANIALKRVLKEHWLFVCPGTFIIIYIAMRFASIM